MGGVSNPQRQGTLNLAQGERRQLTILFCDLVSSTQLSKRLDAEDYHTLASDYHRVVTEACTRFGGYVAKYLGDGVIVYFGYPLANEDDAERAVHAGLAILEEINLVNARLASERLAVRVGIDTGEVVISQGAGTEDEVFGDAPILAARLQNLAAPDTVVISAATHRLTRNAFRTETLGYHSVKGFEGGVNVYRVRRASSWRRSSNPNDARVGRMVGRTSELRGLTEAWDAARSGRGGAVLMRGEAGVGKSRLVLAMQQALARDTHTQLECRGTPYTRHSAFHSVIELLERGMGFKFSDTPSEKLAKLDYALTRAGLDLAEASPVMRALHSLSGNDSQEQARFVPEKQRETTLDILVRMATGRSKVHPVFLIVEDAHNCDPSSLAVFRHLIAQSRDLPVFVLMTARPEFDPPWARTDQIVTLRLESLTQAESREVISNLSVAGDLPERTIRALVERADGNPLYLEELVGSIQNLDTDKRKTPGDLAGSDDDLIPPTLQDSLMARLDVLGPERELAQRAAIIGREFSAGLLAAMLEVDVQSLTQGLSRLIAVGLIFVTGRAPDEIYCFKHALIQEAAYHSMLRKTRQHLHAKVAVVIGSHSPYLAQTAAEVVARHYEAAGLSAEALEYYQRAAEQAAALPAQEEAIVHLRNALRLLAMQPADALRNERELALQLSLALSLVATRGYPDPETRAAYDRALALCDLDIHTPLDQVAAALGGVSVCMTSVADFDSGIAIAQRLLAIKGDDVDAHLMVAHGQIGIPRLFQGRYLNAVDHLDQSLAIYDPTRHRHHISNVGVDHAVVANSWSAWALWILGRGDEAAERALRAVHHAQSLDHPHSLAVANLWRVILLYWRRDMTEARDAASVAETISIRHGFSQWTCVARAFRGAARHALGEGEIARDEVCAGLTEAVRAHQGSAPLFYGMEAQVHLAAGDWARTEAAIKVATAVAARTAQPFWNPELIRLDGELRLAQSNASADAEKLFRTSLDLAKASGAKALALRSATSLGRLLLRNGCAVEAKGILEANLAQIRQGQGTADLIDAHSLLALCADT